MRQFSSSLAKRGTVPLLISLIGPSGSGKTYSALRLAAGIASVRGGKVFGIDTESHRMLHYADRFSFQHVPFEAPYGPLDYLAAVEHCAANGASTIVIDSMSHEHDGQGGVLDQQDEEWAKSNRADNVFFSSWGPPKKGRKKLLQRLVSLNMAIVFCFRGRDKLRPAKRGAKDRAPEKLGLQPIGGADYLFEMMIQALLPSGCDGRPLWHPDEKAAQDLIKVPEQFRPLLIGSKSQLSEETGAALARWAAGGEVPTGAKASPVDALILDLETTIEGEAMAAHLERARDLFRDKSLSNADRARVTQAATDARARVERVLDVMGADRPEVAAP